MNKKSQLNLIYRCFVLLESGISLSESLEIVIRLEKSKKNLVILQKIRDDITKGLSLSKSIENRTAFDPALLSMISFGESSGVLASSMRQAHELLEKGNLIQRKLIGALIYPAFIALATIGMTLFLVMYIFPKIIPLFMSMNIKLPLLTQGVLLLYNFLVHEGLWLVLFLITFILSFTFLYKKKTAFRYKIQSILVTLPIIGIQTQKYYLSFSCRSIGTLLESGQSLPNILTQIAQASTFEIYKKVWMISCAEVVRGGQLSISLRSFKSSVPSMVPDMLSIGERTGSLSGMFKHVSRIFENELEEIVKLLSTVIEPVLMIGMGLIVGSVALSIILPIYEITNHLSH